MVICDVVMRIDGCKDRYVDGYVALAIVAKPLYDF